jgi:hypothetical protein
MKYYDAKQYTVRQLGKKYAPGGPWPSGNNLQLVLVACFMYSFYLYSGMHNPAAASPSQSTLLSDSVFLFHRTTTTLMSHTTGSQSSSKYHLLTKD